MTSTQQPNRLINATSPYLLQHAYNPVDWFEWSPEALAKARQENKPILVSIGYSSCHWCHVMERESFERNDVAEVMNNYFVCIKVDREERPDIDQIYMEAVQALGVNGGWPLNVFLTPDQKPFFGGTYFSPQTWVQVLQNIHTAFVGNRQQIEDTADELKLHLMQSDVARFIKPAEDTEFKSDLLGIFQKLQAHFDKTWGGMDRAPKFIMPSVWLLLLRHHYITKNDEGLKQVLLTLDRTATGGIYDQLAGGFARYSVDAYWFAPHFEKMLYDNAQLFTLFSEAFAITKRDEYKHVVYQTFHWLQSEMTHPMGGFYSALDADSEGVEGKFYVWTRDELKQHLGDGEPLIAAYYNATAQGNWEHGYNILVRRKTDEEFINEHNLTATTWNETLQRAQRTLLEARSKRIRPGLDDKIITAWNAMTTCGLADAYRYFGDEKFLDAAIKNINFLEGNLVHNGMLYRSWKNKRSTTPAFLDDYAYLIQAHLKLYQVTSHEQWLERAAFWTEYVIKNFYDPTDGYFFYSSTLGEALITRKKEIFDNVIPSSNAVMAQNLFHAGTLLDNEAWKQMAAAMTNPLAHLIKAEPNYMSQWAIVFTELKKGMAEVAVVGEAFSRRRHELLQHYHPFMLVQGTDDKSNLPLLRDKVAVGDATTLYVCFNKTCKLPVHTVPEALAQLQ